MNHTLKLLSLVLLSNFALNAQEDVSRDTCKSHTQRRFETIMLFDFELVSNPCTNPPGQVPVVQRPEGERPQGNGNVWGRLELCFSKNLKSLHYKLFIFGMVNPVNLNELIRAAHLHFGRANVNGPVILTLFSLNPPTPCGVQSNGLLKEATVTSLDSNNPTPIKTIAQLHAAILRGDIYANAHGSNTCMPLTPGYPGGIIRNQVLPRTIVP